MADFSEVPLATRLFLQGYPWRRIDPVPWAPLRRPLREAKIAIVSTAGLVPPDAPPFGPVRGGDWSYREVSDAIDVRKLVPSAE